MQKARCHPVGLQQFVSAWFQGLFHSLVQGSFHLSLTVLVHYRSLSSIQPYRMVPADSDRITRVPPYSGYCQVYNLFRVRGSHPLQLIIPSDSTINYNSTLQSYNPYVAETTQVWASPRSLATTWGITIVFFSSGYLDVSVLRVYFLSDDLTAGLPHSEISGSSEYLPLTKAYRSLSRPSSSLRAKAFTMRP